MELHHPDWLTIGPTARLPDDAAAMGRAIALAAENVQRGTGGPFGAVVTDGLGRVVGAGVNVVVASGSSLAHAEVMALLDAQTRLRRPRLNDAAADGPFTLVTSAQPCVMCFGAVFWAGLDALVIGARSQDVERLAGFDEGPLPADWSGELAFRGVTVRRDVLREQAAAVLEAYGRSAGTVY